MKKKAIKIKKKETSSSDNYTNVLLEDMRDTIKKFGEGQTSFQQAMENRFEHLENKLGTEVEILKQAIRSNSQDIKEMRVDIRGLQTDVKELKSDVRELKDNVAELQLDVRDLKANDKIVLEYLSRIDDEITEIKHDLKNNYEKKGWDTKWRKAIEDRLEKIERSLGNKNFSASILRDKA